MSKLLAAPADAVFYIQKGKIKISATLPARKEAVARILGPGEFFDEGCLIGQTHRLSTVQSHVRSRAARRLSNWS